MTDQNRFCLGDRTLCNSIKLSVAFRLHPKCTLSVKSGNFVQNVENRTELDNSDRFVVKVIGFEPTLWSLKPEYMFDFV